jgi:alkaline phosphatase D
MADSSKLKTLSLLIFLPWFIPSIEAQPYMATGFKIGEVRDTSAIIWTRLTEKEQPNPQTAEVPTFHFTDGTSIQPDLYDRPKEFRKVPTKVTFPTPGKVRDIRYAAPGVTGEVRVIYEYKELNTQNASNSGPQKGPAQPPKFPKHITHRKETCWHPVNPETDYIHQFHLTALKPGTVYNVTVESRSPEGKPGTTRTGTFRTAYHPGDAQPVTFTVSTGQAFRHQDRKDGYQIYPTMLTSSPRPDFFVHTGDILYYDALAKTKDLAHWHWQRMYSRPTNVQFHEQVPAYFIKDDHDTWINDCWPTMDAPSMHKFTFQQGLDIFTQQVPMGDKTYRTIRWGKDLQIWLMEGRDFRSSNKAKDGPDKTIWGKEQKAWLKETFGWSDATFRILISPTPIVGPDRKNKQDNHSNSNFQTEGDEIRAFLSKFKRTAVVCGDRHWQFHSLHPETQLHEFSCGPASDMHAGGWSQKDFRNSHHQFLRVKGGYLSVTVDRPKGKPTCTFRFHGVDGKVYYQKSIL